MANFPRNLRGESNDADELLNVSTCVREPRPRAFTFRLISIYAASQHSPRDAHKISNKVFVRLILTSDTQTDKAIGLFIVGKHAR
jgi:hypothetical protein